VALGEHRVRRSVVGFDVEKVVEGAEGGQPAVDGGDGVAQVGLAVLNVGVYVAEGDLVRGFVHPVEEEGQVVGIVTVGGGVGAPAPEPLVEPYNLG